MARMGSWTGHQLREWLLDNAIGRFGIMGVNTESNVFIHTHDEFVYAEGRSGTLDVADASDPSQVAQLLQTAVNQAGLIVSDGATLTIDGLVTIPSNTALRNLDIEGSDNGRIIEFGSDVENIAITDNVFDGNHPDDVTTGDTLQDPLIDSMLVNDSGPYNDRNILIANNEIRNHAGVALDIDACKDVKVYGNYVHNVYAGISFQTRDGVCYGNTIMDVTDIGIDCGTSTANNQAKRWVIANNTVYDTVSHGINVFGNPAHGVISGNVVDLQNAGAGGTAHGITVYDKDFGNGTVSPYQVNVVGNFVARCDIHGVIVRSITTGLPTGVDRSGISVKNNHVKGCDSNGVRVEAGADFDVTGNTSNDNYNGVGVRDATRVNVRANYATGNNNGVFIDDTNTPTDAVVATNYLIGNTTGVSDAAAVAVTRDNDV